LSSLKEPHIYNLPQEMSKFCSIKRSKIARKPRFLQAIVGFLEEGRVLSFEASMLR